MKEARYTARLPEVDAQYQYDKALLKAKYGDKVPCPFCDVRSRKIRHRAETMMVVENDYPYYQFDGLIVVEHLMVVPRRHYKNMSEFSHIERLEYMQLLQLYHGRGYASMTRSSLSEYRSVPAHIHTHLFKYGEEVR